MATLTYTATTGTPFELTGLNNPTSPNNPQGVISIQNDGAGAVTVKGKIGDSASWATIGTVAAASIGSPVFLPGLVAIRLEATNSTGTISY